VKECDLVFLLAGMGGGTGSGAAPVVAEIAAEQGALVIAFVTLPFSFEGGRRLKQAEESLLALRRVCDAVIPLPNDVLLQEAAENETVLDSFARADEWIGRGVKSIWAMLFRTGLINIDFATLRQSFASTRGGKTLFGLGRGQARTPWPTPSRTSRCARCWPRRSFPARPTACWSTSWAGPTSRCRRSTS